MIVEMRTYTLKPGTTAKFETNFAKGLPNRVEALSTGGILAHRSRKRESGHPPLAL